MVQAASLSGRQRIGYSLLLLLLVLLLADLALALAGVGGEGANVSRGFDDRATYIVPDPGRPGGFVTAMMDGETPEYVIPPRHERIRVLLFGGSNTAGFPQFLLQRDLSRLDRGVGKGFEVVKLGRPGYGSERVRILFEQALELLDPDVVLIYTGHNEFVELGFQMDLGDEWAGVKGELARVLSRSQLFSMFSKLFAGFETTSSDGGLGVAPKSWEWEHHKFRTYTYEQTLQRLEGYRDNLEAMCALADERGVEVVLCSVVGNMLASPFIDTLPADASEEDAERYVDLYRAAVAAIPERLNNLVPAEHSDRVHTTDWNVPPQAQSEKGPVPLLRQLLPPLDTQRHYFPETNQWRERALEFVKFLQEFHERDLSGEERADLERARAGLQEAIQVFPQQALSHFQLGVVHYLLGETEQAREQLRLGGRYDCAPRRASDVTNDIVRDVAAAHPEVHYMDVEALYIDRTPDGIIGFELMKDECHFHPAIMPWLMADFTRVIFEVARSGGDQ